MDTNEHALVKSLRKDVRSGFEKYLLSIVRCLQSLNEKEIWWRPNKASNAAGNVILHLCGNVRQWIVSGLGGAPDLRVREKEFSERGPVPRKMLITQLKASVGEACEVIDRLPAEKLLQEFKIQNYRVSGLTAILHVYEHFAYHAGQITYLTKLTRGKDLRLTRLPNKKTAASQSRKQHP